MFCFTHLSMSSSLEKLVPPMEGSNYLVWATAMELYLKAMGLWQIANSIQLQPTIPTLSTANTANVCTAQDARNKWDNENDQVMGAMLLCIDQSLHHHTSRQTTVNGLLIHLRTTFGTPGPALILTDFKVVILMKIHVMDPTLENLRMVTIFGCLAALQVMISTTIQAMTLLAAISHEYDAVTPMLLQNNMACTLTFDMYIIRAAIIAESQQRLTPIMQVQSSATANKLSAAKCKDANPNWQPKQQQKMDSSDLCHKEKGKAEADLHPYGLTSDFN
jgi:hypothetical protein